ncbi:MAG: hypothetical protein GX875_06450 [Propionibacterium sp.]|nr:hypothetical protein [Propionibacterium sp.]
MSAAITDVAHPGKAAPDWVAAQLIEQARVEGVSLVAPGKPASGVDRAGAGDRF